jgi:putative membrane protein
MRLSEQDHARVSAAVTAAEAHTAGEIVTVVAGRSDAYDDVALHWACWRCWA